MSQAWILTEVGSNHERRKDRLQRLKAVVETCGFNPRILDRELCDEHSVKRILVQHTAEPWRISYCDRVLLHLEQAVSGDVIIATESWHQSVFRGLLGVSWEGPPVLEVWIDYIDSFAPWRAFSTEYCRSCTLGVNRSNRKWNERWIVAYPYFKKHSEISSLEIFEDNSDGMDLAHVDYLLKGIPVLAPDWGAFVETITHGKAGMRYKSPQAREYARNRIVEIPSASVIETTMERFTLEQAKMTLDAFLKRALNEGTHKTSQHSKSGGLGCSVSGYS